MSEFLRFDALLKALLIATICCFSPSLFAEAREQKVWIKAMDGADGTQCRVTAYFKGEHDNCKGDDAKGRADCDKESGCVCTRQEKHITWEMDGKESFTVQFDQGDANPFIVDGSNECNMKSNKKGKLRCKVKGKDTPKGFYHYSVAVPHCEPARLKLRLY